MSMTFCDFAGLLMPALPRQSRLVHPEAYEPLVIYLCDIDCAAVRTAEAEIARLRSEYVDLFQNLAERRHLNHCPLAMSRDVEVAVYITAHTVESGIGKLSNQALVAQQAIGIYIENPDVPLNALIYE